MLRTQVYDATFTPGAPVTFITVERMNDPPKLDADGNLLPTYDATATGVPHQTLLDCSVIPAVATAPTSLLLTCPAWMMGLQVMVYAVREKDTAGNKTSAEAFGPFVVPPNPYQIELYPTIARPQAYNDGVFFVGLPYTQEIEMLDLDLDANGQRTNVKLVDSITLEVKSAYGGIVAGPNSSRTAQWKPPIQNVDSGSGAVQPRFPPFDGQIPLRLPGGYTIAGRVYIGQPYPYLMMITGISRDVTLGGDP
jgi:hypothetical protein